MKKTTRPPILKTTNLKWLALLAGLDVVLVAVFAFSEDLAGLRWSQLVVARGVVTLFAPIVVLVLSELLPTLTKASLVYWRGKHALPGHGAFTVLGPADPRVDMKALAKNVGKLPAEPAEQNAHWYRLYKMVDADASILGANGTYLLFRDMAAMSFLLVFVAPFAILLVGAAWKAAGVAAVVFGIQYLITALSARQSGHRLVRNVLAIHATSKIKPNPSAPRQRKRTE